MRRLAVLAVGVGVALSLAAPAAAQQNKKTNVEILPEPPRTNKYDEPSVILPMLLMFVLIGVVVGAGAIPSKRGHQD